MRDLWKRSSFPRVWGMVGTAVDHSDSQLDHPDSQWREGVIEVTAPRRAVVDQDGVGHAVVAKDGREVLLDSLPSLVPAGPDPQREPGVVVQDSQGMAAAAAAHRKVALEVHLPQVVGLIVLEALVGFVLGTLGRVDESVSSQDGRDRALGRHALVASILKHPGQHVTSLGGMLSAQVHDELLNLLAGAVRRLKGTLRQVMQTLVSPFQIAPQPLVASLCD